MQIDYTVQLWKEGEHFVAHAMPLNLASVGPSPEAARGAVDEAVRGFVACCASAGTLYQVLEEVGYELTGDGDWQSPAWISVERRELAIGG